MALVAGCNLDPDALRQPGIGRLRLIEAAGGPGPAAADRLERTIGNHGSLSHALGAVAGLPASAVDPWVHALGGVLDLRRLRPEDRLLVEVTAPGTVARVELVRSKAERYEAMRSASGTLVARRIPILTESRIRRLAGEVKTSLYDAMLAAGGDGETVARVADLLAYDVDFLTDPRPGDRFDVLVEETWAEGEAVGGATVLLARYEGERARQTATRFITPDGRADYYDAAGSSLRKALLRSPLNYRRVTSHFSHRRLHPIRRAYHAHLGVDFAAPVGTPVVAVGDGTVTFAGYRGANGNLVIVKHPNGYETYYLHLNRFAAGVKHGVRIKQGQVIGGVGMTGAATGPHLDFRVKHRGRFLDPEKLTLPPGPPVPPGSRPAFAAEHERLLMLVARIAPGEALPAGELVDYASEGRSRVDRNTL
jgi:murein DD-endopeptidase MepM/ murein hydrolase activator NlpD